MSRELLLGVVVAFVGICASGAPAVGEWSAPPRVFRIACHSHVCRGTQFEQAAVDARLVEWAARNEVSAFGMGSPWSRENAVLTQYYEGEFRDRYYAGETDPARPFNPADVAAVVARANAAPGNRTLYYVDNETPKSRYGHLWYVGFSVLHPNWHDYSQDRPVWYSPLDDAAAETNAVTGQPHRRRTYRQAVDEQRRAGALCVWAHPTSWWTENGDPNGPFVTNIAAEMLPQLMEDGYLDGMTVQGYDAFHRDYQALWFALLDRGYRVPGFSELDISIAHNTTSRDTAFFNLLADDGRTRLTLDHLVREFRAARHTMSSGPVVFATVDGQPQGSELESGADRTHLVRVAAWPAKGEARLAKVELVGRGGEVRETVRDWRGGEIVWRLKGSAQGGYVVVRVFGEQDADYGYKPQQLVRHCALTNPIWLRTDAFRAPAPIAAASDHMANPRVRELMDYLAKGEFRKDFKGCTPGVVPVAAWRIDEMATALADGPGQNCRSLQRR
ncbi:MAG: hypothetical protein ACI4RD_07220 [Kiritimatiellia bacterium]